MSNCSQLNKVIIGLEFENAKSCRNYVLSIEQINQKVSIKHSTISEMIIGIFLSFFSSGISKES